MIWSGLAMASKNAVNAAQVPHSELLAGWPCCPVCDMLNQRLREAQSPLGRGNVQGRWEHRGLFVREYRGSTG